MSKRRRYLAAQSKHLPVPKGLPMLPINYDKRVTIMRDTMLEFPELWFETFLVGPPGDIAGFPEMFARARCTQADSLEQADLVVFGGGVDVNPALYGEAPHKSTRWNGERDDQDIDVYLRCRELGIPMVGVCRGAQFLHVMNGGKLYQDMDNHVGDHIIFDRKLKTTVPVVSSVHHQGCIPNAAGGMDVFAVASKSRERWLDPATKTTGNAMDVEGFFYRDTMCLGFQGHPEYRGYHQFTKWCLDKISDYIVMCPDVEWRGKQFRVKEDILAQRKAGWSESVLELTEVA